MPGGMGNRNMALNGTGKPCATLPGCGGKRVPIKKQRNSDYRIAPSTMDGTGSVVLTRKRLDAGQTPCKGRLRSSDVNVLRAFEQSGSGAFCCRLRTCSVDTLRQFHCVGKHQDSLVEHLGETVVHCKMPGGPIDRISNEYALAQRCEEGSVTRKYRENPCRPREYDFLGLAAHHGMGRRTHLKLEMGFCQDCAPRTDFDFSTASSMGPQ